MKAYAGGSMEEGRKQAELREATAWRSFTSGLYRPSGMIIATWPRSPPPHPVRAPSSGQPSSIPKTFYPGIVQALEPPSTTSHVQSIATRTQEGKPRTASLSLLSHLTIATLPQFMDKKLFVHLQGGRKVSGILRGYDLFLNLVIDEALEETTPAQKHPIGTVVRPFVLTRATGSHLPSCHRSFVATA